MGVGSRYLAQQLRRSYPTSEPKFNSQLWLQLPINALGGTGDGLSNWAHNTFMRDLYIVPRFRPSIVLEVVGIWEMDQWT